MPRKPKISPETQELLKEVNALVNPFVYARTLQALPLLCQPDREELILHFLLQPFGKSALLLFEMMPFFQQHPAIWQNIKEEVPPDVQAFVEKWLPKKILPYSNSREEFFRVATENVREHYPEFPELTANLLSEEKSGYYYRCETGNSIENRMGWEVKMEDMIYGPAETRERITWEAIAIHPKGSLKVTQLYESSAKHQAWMEIIGNLEEKI